MNNNAIAAGLYAWLQENRPTVLVEYHEALIAEHRIGLTQTLEAWDGAAVTNDEPAAASSTSSAPASEYSGVPSAAAPGNEDSAEVPRSDSATTAAEANGNDVA